MSILSRLFELITGSRSERAIVDRLGKRVEPPDEARPWKPGEREQELPWEGDGESGISTVEDAPAQRGTKPRGLADEDWASRDAQ